MHHFDNVAISLMRGERITMPDAPSELNAYITERAESTAAYFNDPNMGQMPQGLNPEAMTDAEILGFFRRRFRAALADGLRLRALARRAGLAAIEETMDSTTARARAALTEIDLGREGRFAELLPARQEQNAA